ncbi:MAG: hypothetical protein ABI682_08520 [Acidobacteriota bacterium]
MPKEPAKARPPAKSAAARPSGSPARPEPTFEITLQNENEWRRAAEVALSALARRGIPFTSNDILKLVGRPPSPSLLPSLVRAAHLNALIEKSDTAPIGTVWIGVHPDPRSIDRTGGRRKTDEKRISRELWEKAHTLASKEKIPTGEVFIRALRAYLKDA